MKIALKYIKRYEDSITPHYNEDGELRGIAIKKVNIGRMFFLMKYFNDDAKEWLLNKFGGKDD